MGMIRKTPNETTVGARLKIIEARIASAESKLTYADSYGGNPEWVKTQVDRQMEIITTATEKIDDLQADLLNARERCGEFDKQIDQLRAKQAILLNARKIERLKELQAALRDAH